MAKRHALSDPAMKVRDELRDKIHLLSVNTTYDYFQMILPHNHDGTAKGPIVVNAFQVYLGQNLPQNWPKDEVRDLWRQSAEFIPGATVVESEPDAGFTLWLWSVTQRVWTACHEMGYAITPYTMWLSGMVTGCAGEQVVNSNPEQATAIEVSLIASHAAKIADTGEKCSAIVHQCHQTAVENLRIRDEVSSQPDSPNLWLADGKAKNTLREYRTAMLNLIRLENMSNVVACYERMLIPDTFKKYRGKRHFTSELMDHLREVAVDLENHANIMATVNTTQAELVTSGEASTESNHEALVARIEADSERCIGRLNADVLLLKSDRPMCDKLRKAYGYWGTYPLWRELIYDSPRNESLASRLVSTTYRERIISTTYKFLCKLNEVHKAAVDVLMARAKELGRDPAAIWKSANYCRELLQDYQKTHDAYPISRERDFWPDCLGATLFTLPADIRQAIQDGHAEVLTLCFNADDQTPPAPRRGLALLDAALLANDDDRDAARETKKRWNNNRDPKLPTPMGVAQSHCQRAIYDGDELLKFIAIVDPDSVQRVRDGYLELLQAVAETVSTDCKMKAEEFPYSPQNA
jgi:hypothetical protein